MEQCRDLAEQLRAIEPPDLYGRLENEFFAASAMIETAAAGVASGGETDAGSWVSAKALWRDHFKTYRQFQVWLEKTPEAEIRRQWPRPNRLEIHAGDWCRYWQKRDELALKALDGERDWPSIAGETPGEYLSGAAARLEALRKQRQAAGQ